MEFIYWELALGIWDSGLSELVSCGMKSELHARNIFILL